MNLLDETKKAFAAPPEETVYWPMPGKGFPVNKGVGAKGAGKGPRKGPRKGGTKSRGGRKSPFPKWTGWS